MSKTRIINLTLYACFLVLGVSATLLGATLQSLTARFGVSLENGGIFTSLQFGGSMFAIVAGGWLMSRTNTRYVLCGGVLLLSSGLLLLSLTSSRPVALAAALLFGVGYGALVVAPNVIVATLNPTRASAALNLLNVFFGLGAIAGPQIVNFAYSRGESALAYSARSIKPLLGSDLGPFALGQGDFRLAYVITAIFALALLPALWMVSVRGRSGEEAASNLPRFTSTVWMALIPFAALLFIYVGTEVGFGAWISTQVTEVAGMTKQRATIVVSIFWAGLTFGRAMGSWLSRHLFEERLLLASIVTLGGGAALLLTFPSSVGVAFVSAFLVGTGCGPVFPTTLAIVSTRYPAIFSAASGILIAIGNLGGMSIPWFQGQVGGGDDGGIIVTLGGALLLLALATYIRRDARGLYYIYSEKLDSQTPM